MTRIATLILVAASLALAIGCSSGGSGPPDVDGTKAISTTTDAEKTSLCDWFANKVGGYGTATTCQDGFIEAPPTRAQCVAEFPTCTVTVATFEACITTIVNAQATCTDQSLLAAQTDANCVMVGDAGCFD